MSIYDLGRDLNEIVLGLFNSIERSDVGEIVKFIENEEFEFIKRLSDKKKMTIIHKSAFRDIPTLFKTIIRALETKTSQKALADFINAKDCDGNTALHYAAFRGNMEIIFEILDHGGIYDLKNHNGLTVIHMGAQGDQPNSMIYFKEKYHMSILDPDFTGSSPLHWACFTAAENSINFLLSWMADVNIRDEKGQTPLHIAIFSERIKLIKKLLYKGADINARDYQGRTALQIAQENSNMENIARLLAENSKPLSACWCSHTQAKGSCFNAVLFMIIHVIGESITYFILLPYVNSYMLTMVYLIFMIIVFLSFVYISSSDPGIIVNHHRKSWLQLVEDKYKVNEYCPNCQVHKEFNTKHCYLCKHCIGDFDHHCNWINNCVGKSNMNWFIFFLAVVNLNLLLTYFISIKAYFANGEVDIHKDYKFTPRPLIVFSMLYAESVKDVVSMVMMSVCIFFVVPVTYVFYLHVRNTVRKKTSVSNNSNSNTITTASTRATSG